MMKDHKDYTFEEPLQAEALNFDSQEPQQQAPFIPDEIPPVEEGMAEVHMKDLQKKSMKTANTRKENPPEWYGQKKKKIIKDFFNLFGIVAACVVVVLLILHRIGVRFSYTAELGEGRPDASVFFTDDTGDARYKWGKEVSLTEEGRYLQVIESSRLYHLVLLVVKDTTPPTARDAGAVITSQESILPEHAVTDVKDASAWTAEWVDEPMFGSAGVITTSVRITDSYENVTVVPVVITAFEPKESINWALGSTERPDPQLYLDVEGHEAAFVTDLDTIDWNTMGDYDVTLSIDSFIYQRKIRIVDGEAPEFTVKNLVVLKGTAVEPQMFIETCNDASAVEYSFVAEPDTSLVGVTNVGIICLDDAGNSAEERAELTVVDFMLTLEASDKGLTLNQVLRELGYMVPDDGPDEEDTEETEETAEGSETGETENTESEESEEEAAPPEYAFVPDQLGSFLVSLDAPDGVKSVYITVKDTTAPQAIAISPQGYTGYALDPSVFFQSIQDATQVTLSYMKEPDWSLEGEAKGIVLLTDESGNTTPVDVTAELKPDEEAPVIYAAIDRNCYVGEAVVYLKEVYAVDNADPNIEVTVDKSAVNSREEGDYPVIYTATDQAGNTTSVEVTYHFIEQTVTDEMLEEMVLDIFSQIFTDDMSVVDQARAIYHYVFNQIYYTGNADHDDWKGEAYRGYTDGEGDCYTYYALTYVLLSHINCEVLSVERIDGLPGHEEHYWCLVNLGTGWYHFDTINVAPDDVQCFMFTQAEGDAHSTHFWKFDTSKYPPLETIPFDENH